jgi:UDP-N-acetylmuramoyl-tripeptide--D-alanyl-D-alanine ligase
VWTFERMARLVGGQLHHVDPTRQITGFSIDSRCLQPGECFIALPGEQTDGHLFLEDAFRKGASGALIRYFPAGRTFPNCIQVPDTHIALQQLAAATRQQWDMPVIGITGSSGKTTTKELIYVLVGSHYKSYRSPGNANTEIGLPLALLHMPPATDVGIFELALQRPGEIRTLSEIVRPTLGVITSIGDAHLGFFKSREELARAKWELIERLPSEGTAVLNFDTPYLAAWAGALPLRVVGFGIENAQAHVRAEHIHDDQLSGVALEIHTPRHHFSVKTPLLGRANVYNVLAGVAVALELGVSISAIQKALLEFRGLPHRMELKRSSRFGLILDDSYNANPTAVTEALRALARLNVPRHRRVLVFGDMLELGGFSSGLHRELADVIDELGLDRVFTVGERAGETALALQKRANWDATRAMHASDLAELKGQLLKELPDAHNLILIKGSRGMSLDRLVAALLTA